jgi:anti-sigma28 factor (negative regulator of flagellin synthesis)
MDYINLKKSLVEYCKNRLEIKLKELMVIYQSLIDSIQTDSKSSAGDKHETFKSMMHIEQEKMQTQIKMINQQINIINQLKVEKKNRIENGTLIVTDSKVFFIAASLGLASISDQSFFIVSLDSPIIQFMKKQSINTMFTFQSTNYKIIDIQ